MDLFAEAKTTFAILQTDLCALRKELAVNCSGPVAPMLVEGVSFGLSHLEDILDQIEGVDRVDEENRAAQIEAFEKAHSAETIHGSESYPEDQCGF